MALGPGEVGSRRYRRPWYWLVVLFLAACVATWLIYLDAQSRIGLNNRQFSAAEQMRLRSVQQRMDDYFLVAIQLTGVGSKMLDQTGITPDKMREIAVSLFDSRRNPSVYGVGVFYAPYGYDPKIELYSEYIHGFPIASRLDRVLPGNVIEVPYQRNPPIPAGDYYPAQHWFQRAVENPTVTAFVGPYLEDGRNFISTMKAFVLNGKVVGVVSVDTLEDTFQKGMREVMAPTDVAVVQVAKRGHVGKILMQTGSIPPSDSPSLVQVRELRYSGVAVRLYADAVPLRNLNREVVSTGAGLGIVVWGFAGLFGVGMFRSWRSREKTAQLEAERAHLENELTIGKKVEAELRKTAYTDALTGLPNRAAFFDRASAAIAGNRTAAYAAFFIDLDRFNMINETMGHVAGDELLKTMGARLRVELPPETMVARIGGDEYLILADVSSEELPSYAKRLLAILHAPMILAGRAVYTEASIGVAPLDSRYTSPEEILRDADIAMYAAKASGRKGFSIFDERMRKKVAGDRDLDDDLRRAVERHEFVPYYQPIVSLETREIISFEALVRWRRPGHGITGAGEFIEFAESRGIVDAIDGLVLNAVCGDAKALFERFPESTIAVNVSAVHLAEANYARNVEQALELRAIPPERVKLEVTETAIMTNAGLARETLDGLRKNGMQILLDDFGAGHSSLAYLHRLPIAGLKIDRSFIEPLPHDAQAVAIVRSIVALAHTLKLYTVAEGVETAAQLELLRELGVLYGQGFFFSPALALGEVLAYAAQSTAS